MGVGPVAGVGFLQKQRQDLSVSACTSGVSHPTCGMGKATSDRGEGEVPRSRAEQD